MYRKFINYIIKKDKIINKLLLDKYFGIYNRNGFEYIISNLDKKEVFIILVDFSGVKEMNKKYGYSKVNKIFTNLFNDLKYKFIIGRAFSGDEIFFYQTDTQYGIETIISISKKHGLNLVDVTGMCEVDNINIGLDKMVDKLHHYTINN